MEMGIGREEWCEEEHHMYSWLANKYEPTTSTQPGSSSSIEKEHMFDKVVTPSDVGKLNRLVIPKQHAEKYFPLDSSTHDKGLLLNFEDPSGKPWRFRYSYWNSSQSYVMTKGWSRFVKDKKLDAGDIVSFHRGLADSAKDCFFIDWRRRPPDPTPSLPPPHLLSFHRPLPQIYHMNRNTNFPCSNLGSLYYLRPALPQNHPIVFESVPVVHGKAAAKRLRLFGVNMDCPISETDETEILSSTSIPHATMLSQPPPSQLSSPSQLSLYNRSPLTGIPAADVVNKGKASMSLDFDV